MGYKKATKLDRKLRMALNGPAGSGKTYTALAIARALVGPEGRIAVLDTEHSSAEIYSDVFDFDADCLSSFSVEKYVESMKEAETAEYDILIIDSLSPAWAGDDGVLAFVDNLKVRNSFTGWAQATPKHNLLIKTMLNLNMHLIVTMRTKMAYELVKDDKGKNVPQKIGLAPVQRDGMEYEFDVIADMDKTRMMIDKSRCTALEGKAFEKAGEDVAAILRGWLPGAPAPQPTDEEKETARLKQLFADTQKRYPQLTGASFNESAMEEFGKPAKECSNAQRATLLENIIAFIDAPKSDAKKEAPTPTNDAPVDHEGQEIPY